MGRIYFEKLNHGQFETWSSKPSMEFYQATQTHSTIIVSPPSLPCEADGLSSSWKMLDRPLAIKTADCMPIVIEGETGVVFLHAGWKGLSDGILNNSEITKIKPQRAFIGPSIHKCCFEVTAEFKDHFKESPYFESHQGKIYFDLQLEAKDQLRKLVPNLLVTNSPICTSCNTNFHSYRRDKTKNRNWNIYIKG